MSYNVDERLGDDHFNCPVVAYYPQVLKLNIPGLSQTRFLSDFVGLHSKKQFCRRMQEILAQYFAPFSKQQVAEAADAAYAEYEAYHSAVQQKAQEYLAAAKQEHQPVVVLCGRPYHVDPEVSHGIDKLLCDLGAAVITETASARLRRNSAQACATSGRITQECTRQQNTLPKALTIFTSCSWCPSAAA